MRLLRILLLASLGLGGCAADEYRALNLVDVSGTVTLDGKPLAGAKVSFFGEDKRDAIGVTDANGRYTLMYDSKKAGATQGPKVVRITQADVNVEGANPDPPTSGEGAVKEPIPARYNRNSELKADVTPSSKTFDFPLKSSP
jgi:hypothetical protein